VPCLFSHLGRAGSGGADSSRYFNSYDNTILYTDPNLATQIEILEFLKDRADTALLYVSDHGESLGERRVYLHGMPYSIAPVEQKRVQLLIWTSRSFSCGQVFDSPVSRLDLTRRSCATTCSTR
jgi:glucan phosphoethanolaminetransferase (alkaline phosphatase superfamily)